MACPELSSCHALTSCRDVLNVLGMYPGDPGPPGSDCAGVIMHTGSAVQGLKPGGWIAPAWLTEHAHAVLMLHME